MSRSRLNSAAEQIRSKSRIWICWRLLLSTFDGSLGRGLNAGLVFSIAALLLVSSALAQGDCKCDASATTADAGPFGSLLDGAEFHAAVQALPPAAFFSPPVQPPLPSQAFPGQSTGGLAARHRRKYRRAWHLRSAVVWLWVGLLHRRAPSRRLAQMESRATAEIP
jgi:hypothetical protein